VPEAVGGVRPALVISEGGGGATSVRNAMASASRRVMPRR
jgi:hypothetical protein